MESIICDIHSNFFIYFLMDSHCSTSRKLWVLLWNFAEIFFKWLLMYEVLVVYWFLKSNFKQFFRDSITLAFWYKILFFWRLWKNQDSTTFTHSYKFSGLCRFLPIFLLLKPAKNRSFLWIHSKISILIHPIKIFRLFYFLDEFMFILSNIQQYSLSLDNRIKIIELNIHEK